MLWRSSSQEGRLQYKLETGPQRCFAWPAICRVLSVCGRASVAMLALEVYGDDTPASRVTMSALLYHLTHKGTHAHSAGPYLKRVTYDEYAWPEDVHFRRPGPATLAQYLATGWRTMADLVARFGHEACSIREWLRRLRQMGVTIVKDTTSGGRGYWVMRYWIDLEQIAADLKTTLGLRSARTLVDSAERSPSPRSIRCQADSPPPADASG